MGIMGMQQKNKERKATRTTSLMSGSALVNKFNLVRVMSKETFEIFKYDSIRGRKKHHHRLAEVSHALYCWFVFARHSVSPVLS
jgi:hypothetical protein